ncbi:MAG: SRPBCC domain-containing protein [Chloroflexi bacterium]|nr:SRPBCC domain-containing protein [Chloroflexota bacterium]
MPATTTDTIERTLTIAAPPETVFSFLTDPVKIAEWMGRSVTADPRPGGAIRVDYNGFDIMRGEFVEVTPHSRVVYTFGWETLAADGVRPGASTVDFSLAPQGNGTVLRMVHRGLPEMARAGHATGWDLYLPQLAQRASGKAVAPPPALTAGEELASRLNARFVQLRETIEACSDRAWKATTREGWPVGVTAHHAASHAGLAHFARAISAGEHSPLADYTADALNQGNANHATEFAGVTREQALAHLLAEGPAAVDAVRGLTAAGLAKTAAMAFAGGAQLSARQIVEGPLLGDLQAHIESIRAAIRG